MDCTLYFLYVWNLMPMILFCYFYIEICMFLLPFIKYLILL